MNRVRKNFLFEIKFSSPPCYGSNVIKLYGSAIKLALAGSLLHTNPEISTKEFLDARDSG